MGCFLACFGSSKDRRKNRHRHKVQVQAQAQAQAQVQPRDHRNASFVQAQPNVFVAQSNPIPSQPIIVPVSDIRVKPEKQLSLSPRKKVTFDSNVTTYEHIKVEETIELLPVEKDDGSKRKEKEENLEKQRQSQSSSQDSSSVTSSSGSYPSNHRYQNCRDSDDELDYGESDVDADDEDEDDDYDDGVLDYGDTLVENQKLGSNFQTSLPDSSLVEKDVKPNPNARDRSTYVNSVLNPVENLTQWKAVKAKATPPLNQQKENLTMNQEPRALCSSEPGFRLSFKEQSKEQSEKLDHEIAVDASLSNWLGSSENTPNNRPSSAGLSTTTTPEKSSISIGSNSPKIFQDRPILGALTVEEIKQFSATSSPKISPSRSPDDMPIIGTVGTYWNHNNNNVSGKSTGSASSFKGIPNTTSKYGEDKRVNWHSTPFETRLERALKETGAC